MIKYIPILFLLSCFVSFKFNSFAAETEKSLVPVRIDTVENADTTSQYFMYLSQPKYVKPKLPFFEESLIYFESISPLLKILVILIFYFVLSIISLFVFVLGKRTFEMIMNNKRAATKARYSEFLARYLYSDDEYELPDHLIEQMDKLFYRKIFIDLLLDLHSNISGEISDKLTVLFDKMQLRKYSIAKVYNRNWHIKAQGFRELAQMGITDANDEILKYIDDKNIILRIEAEMALVKLHLDYPLHFLENLKYKFTDWGQINVYDTFIFHNIEVPQFAKALDSNNDSVVVFALRMIGLYKQTDAFKDVLACLNLDNEEIRENAIIALKHLKMSEALPYLKDIFENETYPNKLLILDAMIVLHEKSNIPFLVETLLREDFNIRLESAISLHKIGSDGDLVLNELLDGADDDQIRIIAHAKDDRIHA